MKCRVLDFKLRFVTGWHKSFANAARKCLETMPQQQVWFIEDENRDIEALIHAENIWLPTDKKLTDHA